MHPIQSQLYADHHNLLRLLHCLEAEIAGYEAGHPYNHLSVILDIFDYVQFYPEQYHHPLEDELFSLLLHKQVENREHILALKAEHKELEALTRKASQLFSLVANDNVVPVNELVGVSREFLNRQIDHIVRENRGVYPMLSKTVSDGEWDSVAAAVAQRKDPLFGKGIMDEYRNLYSAILEAESGIAQGATARAISRPTAAI